MVFKPAFAMPRRASELSTTSGSSSSSPSTPTPCSPGGSIDGHCDYMKETATAAPRSPMTPRSPKFAFFKSRKSDSPVSEKGPKAFSYAALSLLHAHPSNSQVRTGRKVTPPPSSPPSSLATRSASIDSQGSELLKRRQRSPLFIDSPCTSVRRLSGGSFASSEGADSSGVVAMAIDEVESFDSSEETFFSHLSRKGFLDGEALKYGWNKEVVLAIRRFLRDEKVHSNFGDERSDDLLFDDDKVKYK